MKIIESTPAKMVDAGLHTFFLKTLTLPTMNGLKSQMRSKFEFVALHKEDSQTLIAYDDNEIPVGWALIFSETNYVKHEYRHVFIYVSPERRREGFGTALMNKAQELNEKTLTVSKWSGPSTAFYSLFEDTNDYPGIWFSNEFDEY